MTAVNDAPVLTAVGPAFSAITEDDSSNGGQTVASLLGASLSDVDSGAVSGLAIYASNNSRGTWQYSTDGGTSWTAVGVVGTGSALLLGSGDLVRFVPDGLNADTASFSDYGWDQTSGTAGTKVDAGSRGGTSAFSTVGDTATIAVTAVNDAPVLTAVGPAFSAITEDDSSNGGQTVASLLGASLSDVDSGAVSGLAIYASNNSRGTWQYSTDGGTSGRRWGWWGRAVRCCWGPGTWCGSCPTGQCGHGELLVLWLGPDQRHGGHEGGCRQSRRHQCVQHGG